jgi:hypothetical protein
MGWLDFHGFIGVRWGFGDSRALLSPCICKELWQNRFIEYPHF